MYSSTLFIGLLVIKQLLLLFYIYIEAHTFFKSLLCLLIMAVCSVLPSIFSDKNFPTQVFFKNFLLQKLPTGMHPFEQCSFRTVCLLPHLGPWKFFSRSSHAAHTYYIENSKSDAFQNNADSFFFHYKHIF